MSEIKPRDFLHALNVHVLSDVQELAVSLYDPHGHAGLPARDRGMLKSSSFHLIETKYKPSSVQPCAGCHDALCVTRVVPARSILYPLGKL